MPLAAWPVLIDVPQAIMPDLKTANQSPRADAAAGQRAVRRAIRHLSAVDTRLGGLIARIGPYEPAITRDPFVALIGSIIHQQVSMSAGAAIRGRLRAVCPRRRLTPAAILALNGSELRAVGLSRQKAAYVRNIAAAFASQALTRSGLRHMRDEDVITATTLIKGVGRWTAEMLLIFCLERPDVWPVDDFGLRKAVQTFAQLPELPTPAAIRDLADPWRPYRTYATWYLWRSLASPIKPTVAD
jgi:DNA-3-methyladenine glycosylase II